MEIIINPVLNHIGEKNVLNLNEVKEIVKKDFDIDLNDSQKYHTRNINIVKELFVKNSPY